MAYVRKTVDCWRLFVNYGQGWEYEGTDYSKQEAQQTLELSAVSGEDRVR